MRPFAVVPSEYDAFTHQWFREVVVPEYQLHDAKKTARGESWEVSVRVENVGSGVMPVEIAATARRPVQERRFAIIGISRSTLDGRAGQE